MKVALVTAGAQRLGRAISLALGRQGWSVAVHHRSRPDAAEATVRELESMGVAAAAFRADFGPAEAATGLVSRVVERFDRLDLLVHGASPFQERDVAEVSEADWDATFDAVAKAGFFLAQAAAPALRATRGSVVYLSDIAARQAWTRYIPHAAAKAALEALVRSLAVALAPEVRVNAVAPGVVLPPADMDPDVVERLVAKTPLGRRVAVEDVCDAVLFLAANPSITGHVLDVDAGRSLR
jgi:pteridine reductase